MKLNVLVLWPDEDVFEIARGFKNFHVGVTDGNAFGGKSQASFCLYGNSIQKLAHRMKVVKHSIAGIFVEGSGLAERDGQQVGRIVCLVNTLEQMRKITILVPQLSSSSTYL